MTSTYATAWTVYLCAVLVAHGLLWWLLRPLQRLEVRQLIHLCVFAFLVTPTRLEVGGDNWVPAFMAAVMEGIDLGFEAASSRLWPIFALMLVLILLSSFARWYLARRQLSGT